MESMGAGRGGITISTGQLQPFFALHVALVVAVERVAVAPGLKARTLTRALHEHFTPTQARRWPQPPHRVHPSAGSWHEAGATAAAGLAIAE
eukprot:5841684-Pleurochrysis_carterae.AAC.1